MQVFKLLSLIARACLQFLYLLVELLDLGLLQLQFLLTFSLDSLNLLLLFKCSSCSSRCTTSFCLFKFMLELLNFLIQLLLLLDCDLRHASKLITNIRQLCSKIGWNGRFFFLKSDDLNIFSLNSGLEISNHFLKFIDVCIWDFCVTWEFGFGWYEASLGLVHWIGRKSCSSCERCLITTRSHSCTSYSGSQVSDLLFQFLVIVLLCVKTNLLCTFNLIDHFSVFILRLRDSI